MPSFLFRKSKKIRFSLTPTVSNSDGELFEISFEENQLKEALAVLADLFETWRTSWETTKLSLHLPPLSESAKNSISLYESDQTASVLHFLANILVAWKADNSPEFSKNIVLLARELRPSLPYVEFDPEENFSLSPAQLSLLRLFIEKTGEKLKEAVSSLAQLSLEKFNFDPTPLSPEKAESLLRERLGLSFFGDFLDFASEPSAAPSDSFPALLAASAEFDL